MQSVVQKTQPVATRGLNIAAIESWFSDTGRHAILEALTDVCGRLDGNYRDAVQSELDKKAELAAELELLKMKAANVERLEQHNKTLREELAQFKSTKRVNVQNQVIPLKGRTPSNRDSRQPLTPISANESTSLRTSIKHDQADLENLSHSKLIAEYRKLEGKYENLRGEHSHALRSNEHLKKQSRNNHKVYKAWEKHAGDLSSQAENRKRIIQKLKKKLAAATDDAVGSSFTSDSRSVVGDIHDEIRHQPQGQSRQRETLPIKRPPVDLSHLGHESSILDDTSHITSVGSDEVLRRAQLDTYQTDSTEEATDVERAPSLPPISKTMIVNFPDPLKMEPSSDAPVIVSERSVRKRKHDNRQPADAPAVTRVKTEHSSDPLVTDEQCHFKPHESIDFDDAEGRVSTPRKHRASRPTLNPVPQTNRVCETGLVDPGLDFGIPPPRPAALRRINANSPLKRSPAREPKSSAVTCSSLRNGIENLAEDGDGPSSSKSPSRMPRRTGHLVNLLKNVSSERETIDLPTDVQMENIPTTRTFQFPMPQKRELPFKSRVSDAHKQPKSPDVSNSKRKFTAVQPEKKLSDAHPKKFAQNAQPLRERPVWDLGFRDFKPNPKYNAGKDYIYTEVVRDKNQRALLQGRVSDEFRVWARTTRDTTGILEFTSLLEDYLGDDCGKLATMTTVEKERMWEDAKAQELADKHGKNRDRYHRMPSPPGMWNTDFPTTQEENEHREIATRREIDMVEERRREAFRPNGRWLFRDE